MGRYRKEEKLNKLLDNFYEAQIRFNKSVKYYCVQIFCDYENRNYEKIIDKALEYLKRLQEKELITEFETEWLIELLEGDKE